MSTSGMAVDARLIGPIERLLYLRTLPTLRHLGPAELATLAHLSRERYFARGEPLLREGEPAGKIFFLVDGTVSMRRSGRAIRAVEAPFAVGFLPVLARDPNGFEVRAEVGTLTLELGTDELLDAFEDNFSLLEGCIRQFSKQLVDTQRELDARGLMIRDEPVATPYPEQELDLVQRLVLMRKAGPFRDASLDPLIEMATRAVEVRLEPGEVLWRADERASWGLHIGHGVVRCVPRAGVHAFHMGPGSVVGYVDTYANLPRGYDAIAETRVVGLRGDPEAFFDALEDNFELGMTYLGYMARNLTQFYERLAVAGAELPSARATG